VIGIAADCDWTNADASSASVLFPSFTNHTRVNSLASVTGRIGYAWDRFLGYVEGGAWEQGDHDYSNGVVIGTASTTRSGWTVGIGGEYASPIGSRALRSTTITTSAPATSHSLKMPA
jgi:outer membrane immunogenic protein